MKTIAAIDSDSICYQVGAYCNPHPFLKDGEGNPLQMPVAEGVVAGKVEEAMEAITEAIGATERVVCLSSSVSTNFRDEVAVTFPYKGRREGTNRPYHHQTVVDYLLSLPETIVANNREADDDLADLALANPDEVVICTIDKDLDGVHDPRVQAKLRYYNWNHQEYYELTHHQRYRFFCYQLLVGDWSTDSILGCADLVTKVYGPKAAKAGQQYQRREGIGPKKAEEILLSEDPDDWLPAIRLAYQQQFGTDWESKLNEMGQLLFMGGSEDKLWKHRGFYD